jgi:alpha-galactosidase
MMADPNTAASLPVDAIWQLADDMVAAHRDRLPAPLQVPLGTPRD